MARISGGEKVEAVIAALIAKAGRPVELKVGFLEGATYPDGTPVALVAATNEYGRNVEVKHPRGDVGGSYYQAPRPFFRGMVQEKSPGWPKAVATLLKQNDYDAKRTMELMGEGIRGQLQQAIRDFNGAPLAPSTIKAKGFDKQLIDTSHMINSADYRVK